jgi:2-polyprenyl-3-methyl-5-hydroxy-6-metoxy-1,4-benzoquinol methylase
MKKGGKSMAQWTKELFEKYQELFLDVLEERLAQAPGEVDALLKYFKEQGFRPQRILDFNCGIGRHSVELGKRGIKVLGTDISPLYIEVAKKRAKEAKVDDKVRFQVADMREIALVLKKEKPFDGIVCLWTSFGFYDDKTNDDILRQCLKLVRAGGFFVIEIMNRDWLVRNLSERGFTKVKDRIILEERHFNPNNSRTYNTWTYLTKKGKNTFVLDKEIALDYRIWSLHELIEMFTRTGWQFKAAYPGFGQPQRDDSLIESRHLLLIVEKQ